MTDSRDTSRVVGTESDAVASVQPAIGIVILNWNNYPATRRCLDSLATAQPAGATVYVVDNGSSDGSMDRLEAEPAGTATVFVRNGENLGFAAGANRGIRRALDDGNRYILLLNNDCIVSTPGAIESAVALAESDPTCGIVGGKLLMWPDTSRIWGVGGSIGLIRDTFTGQGDPDRGQFDRMAETGFISGAFMLLKAQVIARLGLLPEEYFFGYEDREYSWRARRAGYRLLYQPAAVAYHEAGMSHEGIDPMYLYNDALSRILFKRRTLSPPAYLLWYLAYTVYAVFLLPIRHRSARDTYLRGLEPGVFRAAVLAAIRDAPSLRRISRETLDRFRARSAGAR